MTTTIAPTTDAVVPDVFYDIAGASNPNRPALRRVWVIDGTAYATDSYRLAVAASPFLTDQTFSYGMAEGRLTNKAKGGLPHTWGDLGNRASVVGFQPPMFASLIEGQADVPRHKVVWDTGAHLGSFRDRLDTFAALDRRTGEPSVSVHLRTWGDRLEWLPALWMKNGVFYGTAEEWRQTGAKVETDVDQSFGYYGAEYLASMFAGVLELGQAEGNTRKPLVLTYPWGQGMLMPQVPPGDGGYRWTVRATRATD